jgi:putative transposase
LSKKRKLPDGHACFARKVGVEFAAEDAYPMDGRSRICNWVYNRLLDAANELMAELSMLQGYGLIDDPLLWHMETRTKKNKDGTKESVEVNVGPVQRILETVYSENGLRDLLPELKKKHPFLRSVHSSLLKNAARRLSKAIKRHQETRSGKCKGKPSGWPGYRSWRRDWFSLEYEERNKGWSLADGNRLTVSLGQNAVGKMMSVTGTLIAPPPDLHLADTVRLVKEQGRLFAVFTVAKAMPEPKPVSTAVYIDPNISNTGYGLDLDGSAFEIERLPFLRPLDRQMDKVKRKRDRCQRKSMWEDTVHADGSVTTRFRPSRQWSTLDRVLKRLEDKRREQIKHALFSLANTLFRTYDLVGIGNFVPANADHHLGATRKRRAKANRTIRNNTPLGELKRVLAWVAARSGKHFVVLDETGTTRTCHDCLHVVAGGIAPGVKEWTCPSSGKVHLRDENASRNGLVRLVQQCAELAGNLELPCSGPSDMLVASAAVRRCDWRFLPAGWAEQARTDGGCEASSGRGPLEAPFRPAGRSRSKVDPQTRTTPPMQMKCVTVRKDGGQPSKLAA